MQLRIPSTARGVHHRHPTLRWKRVCSICLRSGTPGKHPQPPDAWKESNRSHYHVLQVRRSNTNRAASLSGFANAQDSGPYKVLRIQLVGGDGGFDYVTADPVGRNLYVARSGPAGHIGVYNLDTLAQVGDIPGASAHGGAVDTATGHGFATSKPVTMFDSKTFAILKKIDVQGNPDGYLNDALQPPLLRPQPLGAKYYRPRR